MSAPTLPFLTKALYDYKSDYEDDLSFVSGQLIKVTAIEDEEWFTGSYIDTNGVVKKGMFPKNFVGEALPEDSAQAGDSVAEESAKAETDVPEVATSAPIPVPVPVAVEGDDDEFKEPQPAVSPQKKESAFEPVLQPQTRAKFEVETPTTTKGLSTRISTFDSESPVPIPTSKTFEKSTTAKPYQGNSSYVPPSFGSSGAPTSKKFDLSQSSYVPPMLGTNKPATERTSTTAPPPPPADVVSERETVEEEGPKLSLKERIALLQKQQAEEAERLAAAAAKKKQHKEEVKAAKEQSAAADLKPTEDTTGDDEELADNEEAALSTAQQDEPESPVDQKRAHIPGDRIETEHYSSDFIEKPGNEDLGTKAATKAEHNDNKQGGDDDADNTDDDDDVGDDEEEEEEEDPEEAKRAALRERMARLAGAGSMFGSAGGSFNPFGVPSAKKTPKKSKAKKETEQADIPTSQAAPVPMIPFASGTSPELPKALKREAFVAESAGDATHDDDEKSKQPTIELPKPTPVETYITDETVTDAQDEEWKSEVGIEESFSDEEQFQSADEVTETLSERLEKVDINAPVNTLSESAVEGDDEQEEKDTSEDEFTQINREQEIKDATVEHVPVPHIPQGAPPQIHSDYTTGYESDDDTAPPTVTESVRSQSIFDSEDISQRAPPPPPPPPGPAATAPKSVPPPPIPSVPEIPPTPTRAPGVPPPVPDSESMNTVTPVKPAPPPPPPQPSTPSIPQSIIPPVPAPPAPFQTVHDDGDAGSINSSIISPSGPAPPLPSIDDHQRALRRASTIESSNSVASQPSVQTPNLNRFPPNEMKKAATFDQGANSSVPFPKTDVGVDLGNCWWLRNGELPPTLQARVGKDLIFEVDSHLFKRRGGRELVLKDYYILHQDNTQTIINISYETSNPQGTVNVIQKFEPAPSLNKSQLDEYSKNFGTKVFQVATRLLNQTLNEPLIPYIFKQLPGILPAIGLRSYGAVIYINSNNTEVHQDEDFKPGDIIAINKAKFQGHNKLRQKISYEVGNSGVPFAAVITEFDPDKRKFRVIEVDKNGKVKHSSYKPTDMKSGKIKVFRPVGRDYVNW